jgi:hypothetical protein
LLSTTTYRAQRVPTWALRRESFVATGWRLTGKVAGRQGYTGFSERLIAVAIRRWYLMRRILMPILAFNKASDPKWPDDVRIASSAVRYVEESRLGQSNHATIHVLGHRDAGIKVGDSIESVVSSVGGLVAATRHYLAGQPADGGSTVYVSAANVSHIRPSTPGKRDFWVVHFIDGSELRIVDPLPAGL